MRRDAARVTVIRTHACGCQEWRAGARRAATLELKSFHCLGRYPKVCGMSRMEASLHGNQGWILTGAGDTRLSSRL